jgi:hypothetical protein
MIEQRLAKLEQALGARRMVYRAYATRAEAEAASDPPDGATTVVRIITGVPRLPTWAADHP